MKNRTLQWLIIIGMISIISNVGIQLHLLRMAFSEGQTKFSQTVHVALLQALQKIYGVNPGNMPETSPVKKVSNDYYVVDVNDHIDADVLEYYLKSEFISLGISTDFEYGIYDCETDKMVYGKYVKLSGDEDQLTDESYLSKYPDLVYYFGVRFPDQANYVLGTLSIWVLLMSVSVVILLFFVYGIVMVLRQKKLSELHRDFVNNMTHEFKTPITSTKIALDYIQQNDLIRNNKKLSEYCSLIASQTDHLNRQVETILQNSLIEKKTFPIEKERLDLTALLKTVSDAFITTGRNVQTSFDDKEVFIRADRLHLSNIVYSLLDNALKYSAPDSEVHIRTFLIGSKIKICVEDRGIGIHAKQIPKIFKKFYRVPTGDIHNVKGFGLGLFYVKRICDRHGWKISVESQAGVGSKFCIGIPIEK